MPLLLLLLLLCGCEKKCPPPKPLPLVKVTHVQIKDVPRYIETVGHIESILSVDMQAQVTGIIEKQHFERGDYVQKGEVLFTIDRRPFQARLEKSEALLSQNLANLQFAKETTERNTPLVEKEYISKNAYDNLVTNTLVDEAQVKETVADINLAMIDLSYCTLTAPFDARTGDIEVTEGNIVYGNDSKTLVTLNQIIPIYANYFIPERFFEEVRTYQRRGDLTTLVWYEGGPKEPVKGKLFFIDNGVNKQTGMILLKSTFPNEDMALWPDQYVRVQLVLEILPNAMLLPAEAIGLSTKGKYVYVVKNGIAEQKYVTVGQSQGDNLVIEKGIEPSDVVVLEGQINLYPGAKVRESL